MSNTSLPAFHLPPIVDSNNGWGPSSHSFPPHLLGLPFMPFNKSEKLTRISDWSFSGHHRRGGIEGQPGTTSSNKIAEEEEIGLEDEGGAFSLVDNKVKVKPRSGWGISAGGYRPFTQQNRPRGGGQQRKITSGSGGASASQQAQQQALQQQQQQRNAATLQQQQATGIVKIQPATNTPWNTLASGAGQQQSGQKRGTSTTTNIPSTQSSSSSNTKQTGVNPSSGSRGRMTGGGNQSGGNVSGRRGGYYGGFEQKDILLPSIHIQDDWKLMNEIEFNELTGVTYQPREVEDLFFAGQLLPFNPVFNRITPRTATSLIRYENRQFFSASTTEDPLLNQLINEQAGTIYATDSILSVLMSASKSVYGWDLLVKKIGNNIIIDKRSESKVDWLSVNENHQEGLSEEADNINHAEHLALEATVINHNFSQQVLVNPTNIAPGSNTSQPLSFPEPHPFLSSLVPGQEPANVGFRYTKFDLGPNTTLITRSSINAYTKKSGTTIQPPSETDDTNTIDPSHYNYILTRTLNEFDPKISGSVDWRQKLESQPGAALAIEMKNNNYRLHRYVSELALSCADSLTLGFISRHSLKNSMKHNILLAKSYGLQTLAESLNIKVKGLWGSLKVIIDRLLTLEDGSYLMMKDPNKPVIHIYQVPSDTFIQDTGGVPAVATTGTVTGGGTVAAGVGNGTLENGVQGVEE